MRQYLELLKKVRAQGAQKTSRGVLQSTGTRPDTLSVFAPQMRFDLGEGFPLVTTKRVPFDAVVYELLWFLSGDTNVKYLHDHKVKIWDEWADPVTGELGPIYGRQWRSWAGPNGQVVDQIADLVSGLRKHPDGRRHIVSAWNPADIPDMKLPPCHALFQFYVADHKLSCQLYQRSADLFLGVPFNVASYALLTHMVAQVIGLGVGEFIHTSGDAHIYWNHLAAVDEQLTRVPHPLPRIELDPSVRALTDFRREHIVLKDYVSDARIAAEVAV